MREDNTRNNYTGEIGSGCLWAMLASVFMFAVIPVFGFLLAMITLKLPTGVVYVFSVMSFVFDVVMYMFIRKKDFSKGARKVSYFMMILLTSGAFFMLITVNGSLS